MVGKSYPMEEREDRNPVIKEPFDFRMEIRQYEPRIKVLERGVERLEQSCYAIVERLKALENRQNAAMYNNDSEMDFSGAFETDIEND